MKIYTKTGDDGTTGIQGGKRISKSNLRIQAYGAVDEINASIGVVLSKKLDGDLESLLQNIQNDLFVAGADLSNSELIEIFRDMDQDKADEIIMDSRKHWYKS